MKQNRIVITGGIATGKSVASAYLRKRGYAVIDADAVARRALEIGEEPYLMAVKAFGERILHADRTVNRTVLGEIIFSDPEKRAQLDAITHPWIFARMREEMERMDPARLVFLDIPLYYEANPFPGLPVWLIYAPCDLQIERLQKRNGYDRQEATQRIASQMDIEEKRHLADVVLENTGTVEALYQKLDEALEKTNAKG